MGVRPYDVSPPLLEGVSDPDIDYFDAIEAFAKVRFVRLAGRVITLMQRMAASGIFSDETRGMKSVWDEWCWYQDRYDSDCGSLSDGFEMTLNSLIAAVVEEIEPTEAVLLSCSASEDQSNMPCRSNDVIAAVLYELVTDAAGARSMYRFEVD